MELYWFFMFGLCVYVTCCRYKLCYSLPASRELKVGLVGRFYEMYRVTQPLSAITFS